MAQNGQKSHVWTHFFTSYTHFREFSEAVAHRHVLETMWKPLNPKLASGVSPLWSKTLLLRSKSGPFWSQFIPNQTGIPTIPNQDKPYHTIPYHTIQHSTTPHYTIPCLGLQRTIDREKAICLTSWHLKWASQVHVDTENIKMAMLEGPVCP